MNSELDDRGVTPVVGKVMEVGLVMLFVGVITITLYGGIVPDYRSAAGDEVADRIAASASLQIQAAIPPDRPNVRAVSQVDLPDTIRGQPYEVVVDDRTVILDHPHPDVSATAGLAVPASVIEVTGSWSSHEQAWVVVERDHEGLVVRLERGGRE